MVSGRLTDLRMPKKLYNEPSPLETRVLSKRFGLDNSETLAVYLANDGFKAFRKAREHSPPELSDTGRSLVIPPIRTATCLVI